MNTPLQTSVSRNKKITIDPVKLQQQKDALNQKLLTDAQRDYLKCARGKCPIIVSERMKRMKKLFGSKKQKKNFLDIKSHDRQLSRLFQEKGRKKRIEILSAVVSELNLKLQVANSKLHVNEIEENYRKIEEHLRIQNEMEEAIKKTKMEIGHIKSQIERLDRKNRELDKETESEVQFTEHLKRANRQLEIYERKVEIARQKECKMTSENLKLREFLQDMLIARAQFNKHWSISVKKLKNRKKFLLDMIERSSQAFSQSDDFLDDYKKILSRRRQSKENATAEMLKMKRQIDANDIISMFLEGKGKRRNWEPIQKKEVKRRENLKKSYNDQINFYKNIIEESKKITKTNDIKNANEILYSWDNESFQIFNYINKISIEFEDVLKDMSETRNEVIKSSEMVKESKNYYQSKIEELTVEMTAAVEEQSKLKQEIEKYERKIDLICKTLSEIIQEIKCDTSSLNLNIRDCSEVTKLNVRLFFSLFERHINRILAYIYCKERDEKKLDLLTENQKLVIKSLKRDDKPIVKIHDTLVTQCPECAEIEDMKKSENDFVKMLTKKEIHAEIKRVATMPEISSRMHTLSVCKLPRSGAVASRRYAQ
ncbi:hypothetical protein PVAND_001434 [Polypedilum vanderplanki]|uniref:ODAD1 central coiled coil region domain-containing protein n=1 Tax=Polypedilum vanderplanki TaxID=319348 RepID=A0A9J6BMY2_POLVA|nr:hypothetical protein PVAND_001434 [Polypedilum vanderplanki]